MKTYKVFAQVTVGAWAIVTAHSLEAAQDKADELEFDDYVLEPKSFTEILQLEIEFGGEHDPEN
jgi:hypothetical protein